MSRSRILTSIAAASLGVALLGACSAESLTERAVGFGLEQATEGDQDIDIDFGGDGNGGFSVSTDEGDFSVNFDQENGSIVFETDEGDGSITFDEENGSIVFETDEGDGSINFDEENGSIVFETDEGDGSISFDEENGSIVFETDEGDGSINFDEETGITFETEDGSASVVSGSDVPAEWPAEVGVPRTMNPAATTFSVVHSEGESMITGLFQHSPDDPYASEAQAGFAALGWTVVNESDNPSGLFIQLANGDNTAEIVGGAGGFTAIAITVATSR